MNAGHVPFIPKTALLERVEGPYAETIRTVIDNAYAIADAAHWERDELNSARTPGLAARMKDAVRDRYVPQLAEVARPLAALRDKVAAEQKANRGSLTPQSATLRANLSLADGALWCARRNLAPMAGMTVGDLEVMALLEAST